MKKILLFMLALLPVLNAGAQSRFAKYLDQAENAPFVVVDKQSLKLTLVDPQGEPIKEYGISVAVNYGPKKVRGDHKTPEGTFKINQLLNAKGLSHDFKDGKGPVKDAYGPWFLRLDVPGFWDIGIHGTPFPESIGSRGKNWRHSNVFWRTLAELLFLVAMRATSGISSGSPSGPKQLTASRWICSALSSRAILTALRRVAWSQLRMMVLKASCLSSDTGEDFRIPSNCSGVLLP